MKMPERVTSETYNIAYKSLLRPTIEYDSTQEISYGTSGRSVEGTHKICQSAAELRSRDAFTVLLNGTNV